ncbi:MAG: hypothetical protein IMZ62_14145, partial [Chloroflexi bacterium]|nr:hypothetical protein [Chloroflexota bacterium]
MAENKTIGLRLKVIRPGETEPITLTVSQQQWDEIWSKPVKDGGMGFKLAPPKVKTAEVAPVTAVKETTSVIDKRSTT